jgi:hypothetical protein
MSKALWCVYCLGVGVAGGAFIDDRPTSLAVTILWLMTSWLMLEHWREAR